MPSDLPAFPPAVRSWIIELDASVAAEINSISQTRKKLQSDLFRCFVLHNQKVAVDLNESASSAHFFRILSSVSSHMRQLHKNLESLQRLVKQLHRERQSIRKLSTRLKGFRFLLRFAFLDPVLFLWQTFKEALQVLRHPSTFTSNRKLVFILKHFTVFLFALLPILVMTPLQSFADFIPTLLDNWQVFWVFSTTVAVFHRTFETVLFRSVLRCLFTSLAAVISFFVMESCFIASSGIFLSIYQVITCFIVIYFIHGPFWFAGNSFLITQAIVIDCQFARGACVASWSYAFARIINTFTGSMICIIVCFFLFPAIGLNELRDTFPSAISNCFKSCFKMMDLFGSFISVDLADMASPPDSALSSETNVIVAEIAFDPMADEIAGDLHETEYNLALVSSGSICDLEKDVQDLIAKVKSQIKSIKSVLKYDSVGWKKGPFSPPSWMPKMLEKLEEFVTKAELAHSLMRTARSPDISSCQIIYGHLFVPMNELFTESKLRSEILVELLDKALRLKNPSLSLRTKLVNATRQLHISRDCLSYQHISLLQSLDEVLAQSGLSFSRLSLREKFRFNTFFLSFLLLLESFEACSRAFTKESQQQQSQSNSRFCC